MMPLLTKLLANVVKEFRVVARDRASLAILFAMPVGFVIIMSLALQDIFRQGHGADKKSVVRQFSIVLLDGDGGEVARAIHRQLSRLELMNVTRLEPTDFAQAAVRLREEVRAGRQRFALIVPPGVSRRVDAVLARRNPAELFNVPPERKVMLELLADPALRSDQRLLVSSAIERVLQGVEILRAIAQLPGAQSVGIPGNDGDAMKFAPDGLLGLTDGAPDGGFDGDTAAVPRPTSTQQNVSAYSLLAIFMLVVPLSQTFIKERAQGSLMRLRSIPVPGFIVVGGKVLPYFLINLLQVILCLGVGRFVLPILGGDALQLGRSPAGIVLLSAAASLAAIGFALMVSMFARTAEQAAAFGATAILMLAALGGIMVPKTVMPASLQHLAILSPLGWAQDGFLDLFVRGAGMVDVLRPAGALLAFAATCMILALWRFSSSVWVR